MGEAGHIIVSPIKANLAVKPKSPLPEKTGLATAPWQLGG
jgi:hypothetical protein